MDGSFLGGVNARRFTCRALFLQSIILELQLNPRDRHLNRTLLELCEDVIENGTAVSTTWWVFQILFDCVSDQEKKYRFACNTFFLLAAELWRSPVPIVFGGGGGLRVWPGRSRTQCFHVKQCLFGGTS